MKLVTLAPNMDGAMVFIREVHDEVCISLGHTGAGYDCSAQAMKLGAIILPIFITPCRLWRTENRD